MLVKTLENLSIGEKSKVIFVNPESSRWVPLLEENKRLLKQVPPRLKIQDELLAIARRYTRKILNITCPAPEPENIIATGHQPCWHHCGIWAKDIVTCKFAQVVGAAALHLVVDHDICDTAIILPKQDGGEFRDLEKLEIEHRQKEIPVELRGRPGGHYVRAFCERVLNMGCDRFCGDVWSKLTLLSDKQTSGLNSVADLVTYLQAVLSNALGLDMLYLPVSLLCQSDAFLHFAASIVTEAERFAECYNRAIAGHITLWNIKESQTIRRLATDEKTGSIELPFWLLDRNGRRRALHVVQTPGGPVEIRADADELGSLDSTDDGAQAGRMRKMLARSGFNLRPKAVVLTLFVRVYLADWFVHGVGGARYECITNRIIEDFYGIKGLSFGIVTANVHLPAANQNGQPPASERQVKGRLRELRYSPEKFIPASVRRKQPVQSMIMQKQMFIETATNRELPEEVKRAAFNSTCEINKKLMLFAHEKREQLEQELKRLQSRLLPSRAQPYREYFFGLFPQETLREMVDTAVFTEKG